MRLMPGELEDVITFFPQLAPPYTILMDEVSLSAWSTTIPVVSHGLSFIKVSMTSDCGVIGYPKYPSTPLRIADMAIASFPFIRIFSAIPLDFYSVDCDY